MKWYAAMPSVDWPACASAAAWAWRWRLNATRHDNSIYQSHLKRKERKNMARVALVTGGMGGLGEAICMKMAALGYQVVTTHSPGNNKANEWLASMEQQGYRFR